MNGKLVWQKDLGDKSMRNEFGEGSTPVLYRNRLVVVWDHTKGSFITALDKNTGNELWRVSRDEIDTWATPYVVEHGGRAQVIVPGMNKLHSYDLETGAVVWHSQGLTMNPIPSPVGEDGIVIATSGFRGNNLKAIRIADAKGDLTGLERDPLVARSRHAIRPVAGALRRIPVSAEEQLADSLGVRRENRQAALSASAARRISEVFSSPVGAAGRVYITGRDGNTVRASQRRHVRSARQERIG